jgi:hypothetical protein
MKPLVMTIPILACTLALLTGCDSADNPSEDPPSSIEGTFTVNVSNGTSFTQETDGARVDIAAADLIELEATDWFVRVSARDLPDRGPGETNEFGRNNTSIALYVEVEGEQKRVGCDPADPVQGVFRRTELTDTHVSGDFQITFVSCDDYFTAEPVTVPGLPFTVTGSFSGLRTE